MSDRNNLFAYTAASGSYPGYVSINKLPSGDVEITVREAPAIKGGVFVCGFAADKGKPGRCTPGDDRCNNYCNMAPSKGPMQPKPLDCTHTIEGQTAVFIVPAEEWARMQPC